MDLNKEDGIELIGQDDVTVGNIAAENIQIDKTLHESTLVMDGYSQSINQGTSDNTQNKMEQNPSVSVVDYSHNVSMVTGTEIPVKQIGNSLDTLGPTQTAGFAVLAESLSQQNYQQELDNRIQNQDGDGLSNHDISEKSQIVAKGTDNKNQKDAIILDSPNVSKDRKFNNMLASSDYFVIESQDTACDLIQPSETVTLVTSNDMSSSVMDQNADTENQRMNQTIEKSLETITENFPQQTFSGNSDAAVTMVTDSENSWYQINQNFVDQKVIEVKTEKVEPGSTPVLKIMKIVDQVQQVERNAENLDYGKIVLDDAVLRAILLATSNDSRKDDGQSATSKSTADATEVISYEDGNQTVITIVHSDNEIKMNTSEIVAENDLSVGYIENVSEEGVQQIETSEIGQFETIQHLADTKTSSAVRQEKTGIVVEKGGNPLEMLQKSVNEIDKGKGLIHELGQNIIRSDNSEDRSSKNMPKEMSSNSVDGLYTVKLTLDDLCNVINENTETLTLDSSSCMMKSTGVQTSDITESHTHCEVCNKFIRKNYFKHHTMFHTGEKKYSCEICKKAFMTSQHLRRHQVVHSKEKPFPCELCGNCYTQKTHLKIHMRTHYGERNYKCTICDRSFFQSQNLKRHMISHSDDRPYNCKSCDKTFKFKDHLIDHERLHSEKPLYECEICNMPFKTRSALFSHKISHSAEKMAKYKKFKNRKKDKKNFSCTKCGKSFMVEKTFNTHKCSENKNFLCDICSRYFLSRVSLVRHRCRKAELEELPRSHACMTCGEKYFSELMLREHQLHAHIKNATFSCEICGFKIVQDEITPHLECHVGQYGRFKCHCCEEEFGKTESLKKHMLSSHPKSSYGNQDKSTFNCSVCSKRFKSEKCLANHMNRYHEDKSEYSCHVCSLNFKDEAELKTHIKSHKEGTTNTRKDYECEVCHKTFVEEGCYDKHIKIHRGTDKKYKCHFCSEQFTDVVECRQHISEKKCSKAVNVFKCKFCNRQYNKCLFLNEHLKGHLGSDDQFRCIDCPEYFQNNEDLKEHYQAHTDIIHECSVCERCFNDKLSLDRHIERHNGSKEAYKCADCMEEFQDGESLQEHVKSCHKINVIVQENIVKNQNNTKPSCEICGKYFCNQWRLTRHLKCFMGKTKTYRCHKCSEEFDEVKDAKSHMDEIHGNNNIKKQTSDITESDFSDTEKSEGEIEGLSPHQDIQDIDHTPKNQDTVQDGSLDIPKNKDTSEPGSVDIPDISQNKVTSEPGRVDMSYIPKNKDTSEPGRVDISDIPKNKDTSEPESVNILKYKHTSKVEDVNKAKDNNKSVDEKKNEITKNKNNKINLRSDGNKRKRLGDNIEKDRNLTDQLKKRKNTTSQNNDNSGEKMQKRRLVTNDNKTINKRTELKPEKELKRKRKSQEEKPKKNKDLKKEKLLQNESKQKSKTQAEQEDIGTRRSQRKIQRPAYLSNYVDQKK
ncbi:hypothetical protein KUTeg_008127 [Tegillarca granosa]|uniref:C2H2-type domain-containing protein n=1 Tax=Tegillarca granosa TaxID=220873 RepID=A0ABQ9F892_TEGGR|nr:hypothetical protein KUTeg_008127 [Tegillarca granosa]